MVKLYVSKLSAEVTGEQLRTLFEQVIMTVMTTMMTMMMMMMIIIMIMKKMMIMSSAGLWRPRRGSATRRSASSTCPTRRRPSWPSGRRSPRTAN